MIKYKQTPVNIFTNKMMGVERLSDTAFIPFDPANTDYANFKKEILADEAQLEDVDGLTLSAAEAKTYVSSLP